MDNCIFSAHCTESICDMSCPRLVETSYLLERNGIGMRSKVFNANPAELRKLLSAVDSADADLNLVSASDTVRISELLTYCAICRYWQGSQLHCTVYHLKYSKYLDELKKSWSTRVESNELEYMRIFTESCKVLIVSNLDYVRFGDFESQTLLNILQSRQNQDRVTFLVRPSDSTLVSAKSGSGESQFFLRLKSVMNHCSHKVDV